MVLQQIHDGQPTSMISIDTTEHIIKQIMPCSTELWAVYKNEDGTKFSDRIVGLALTEVVITHKGQKHSYTNVVGLSVCHNEIFDASEDCNFEYYSPVEVNTEAKAQQ